MLQYSPIGIQCTILVNVQDYDMLSPRKQKFPLQRPTSTHCILERITSTLEEQARESKVCNEDSNQGNNHGRCCRLANALGSSMGCDSPGTAHHCDNGTKHLRFQQGADQVPWPQRPARRLQNDAEADAKDRIGQERRGREAEREADQCQDRERKHTGEHARDHEVVDGVGAEDAQGVGLLRHLHGAELGGELRPAQATP